MPVCGSHKVFILKHHPTASQGCLSWEMHNSLEVKTELNENHYIILGGENRPLWVKYTRWETDVVKFYSHSILFYNIKGNFEASVLFSTLFVALPSQAPTPSQPRIPTVWTLITFYTQWLLWPSRQSTGLWNPRYIPDSLGNYPPAVSPAILLVPPLLPRQKPCSLPSGICSISHTHFLIDSNFKNCI